MTYGSYINERQAPQLPPRQGLPIKRIVAGTAIALVLIVGGCSALNMGKTVEPGNAGVKIKTLGTGAGVQPNALRSGWHFKGIGERIVEYPIIQRTYSYTREQDERGPENEEIVFTDRTGLPMTADVAAVIRVQPQAAPSLYTKYRLSFDELLEGPIRNDIRSAVAAASEKRGVEQLLAGGRQQVIAEALRSVQSKWVREGVEISQLEWIGQIRFPAVIQNAIQSRTQADQQVLAAQAQVAVANAQADREIAVARGVAESTRIRGEALKANPQVIEEIYAKRSSGFCYPENQTCIIGTGAGTIWNQNGDRQQ